MRRPGEAGPAGERCSISLAGWLGRTWYLRMSHLLASTYCGIMLAYYCHLDSSPNKIGSCPRSPIAEPRYVYDAWYCVQKSIVRLAAMCRVARCCPGGLAVQCARCRGPSQLPVPLATGHRTRVRVRALLQDAAARDGREGAGRRRHTVDSCKRAGVRACWRAGVLACGVIGMSLMCPPGLDRPAEVRDRQSTQYLGGYHALRLAACVPYMGCICVLELGMTGMVDL